MTLRRWRAAEFLGAMLTALVLLAVSAPAASAHAALLATTPGNNEVLPRSPAEVTLTFGEPVGTGLGALKILGASGERADTGQVTRSGESKVVHVPLRPILASGSYVVLWRVVSADSHPVSGTFVFSIGKPTALTGYQGRITPPRSPSLLLGLMRGFGFGALVVFLGGAVFCLLLWPDSLRLRTVRRVLVGAAGVELLTAVGALLLQGPYAAGLGAGHALDNGLLSSVLETQYGKATATRIGLSLLAVTVALTARRLPHRLGAGLLVGLGVIAAATWSAAGHAGTGTLQPFTFGSDVLHLVAVSAWTGGLVLLGFALRGWWSDADAAARLPSWSRLATVSVLVMIATGVFASWREVRSFEALTSTRYGALLLTKTVLVLFMLLLGAIGRSIVRRRYMAGVRAAIEAARLRRTTLVEAIAAALVLVVTAVLVQTPPAASAFAPPYSGVSSAGPYMVQADLFPARKGVNGLHIYTLGPEGRTVDVAEVSGVLTLPDGETLTIETKHESLGHYEVSRLVLPSTGLWTLTLQIRASDIDSFPATQKIEVR